MVVILAQLWAGILVKAALQIPARITTSIVVDLQALRPSTQTMYPKNRSVATPMRLITRPLFSGWRSNESLPIQFHPISSWLVTTKRHITMSLGRNLHQNSFHFGMGSEFRYSSAFSRCSRRK